MCEIPVLANFFMWGESCTLGPDLMWPPLLAVKVKDVDGDGTVNNVEEYDRDVFSTFDYGVAAGVGFDFEVERLEFAIIMD